MRKQEEKSLHQKAMEIPDSKTMQLIRVSLKHFSEKERLNLAEKVTQGFALEILELDRRNRELMFSLMEEKQKSENLKKTISRLRKRK